jgi:ankyrin repeat protein
VDGNNLIVNILKYGTIDMIQFMLMNYTNENYNLCDHLNIHIVYYLIENSQLSIDVLKQFLLLSNVDLKMCNENMGSLLFHVIKKNQSRIDLMKFLLEFGADTNSKDDNNNNIIFYCVTNGLVDISYLLMNTNGFDVNVCNTHDESLLEVAIIKNMIVHCFMILDRNPMIMKIKSKIIKMMTECIDNKNTIVAFKLLQHYSANVIQNRYRKSKIHFPNFS